MTYIEPQWERTKEEEIKIAQIIKRALSVYKQSITNFNTTHDILIHLEMDFVACNNSCPLDFDKLLAFDDFNFFHDVLGIHENINRKTGQLDNFFLPRCSKGGYDA